MLMTQIAALDMQFGRIDFPHETGFCLQPLPEAASDHFMLVCGRAGPGQLLVAPANGSI